MHMLQQISLHNSSVFHRCRRNQHPLAGQVQQQTSHRRTNTTSNKEQTNKAQGRDRTVTMAPILLLLLLIVVVISSLRRLRRIGPMAFMQVLPTLTQIGNIYSNLEPFIKALCALTFALCMLSALGDYLAAAWKVVLDGPEELTDEYLSDSLNPIQWPRLFLLNTCLYLSAVFAYRVVRLSCRGTYELLKAIYTCIIVTLVAFLLLTVAAMCHSMTSPFKAAAMLAFNKDLRNQAHDTAITEQIPQSRKWFTL